MFYKERYRKTSFRKRPKRGKIDWLMMRGQPGLLSNTTVQHKTNINTYVLTLARTPAESVQSTGYLFCNLSPKPWSSRYANFSEIDQDILVFVFLGSGRNTSKKRVRLHGYSVWLSLSPYPKLYKGSKQKCLRFRVQDELAYVSKWNDQNDHVIGFLNTNAQVNIMKKMTMLT